MINLKLQNMKQAAYFDYFKSFSLNASDTIKKLQLQFNEQIQESFFLDHSMMFKRIKTLLGSYEILIYEINDSCEFLEIPQFGNCILKIFLQIMSVIRFLLHKIVQKSSKKQDPSPLVDRTNSFQKTHKHMNMTHTHLSHSPSIHQQNRLMYKKKEQSKYIINTLNQELSLLELEQSENLQASKKQLRSLIQGKEKLQSIEISQNENILSQALNSFCKKGQHLKNFVNVRQAAMISNMKEGVGEYMKVKDILDEDSNAKLQNASIKLQELFKTHTINYLKEKQSEMVSQEVQVKIQEPLDNKILEENKHIKRLNDLLRKVNDQLGFEQQKNKSLENLLKSKNEQFQLKAMQFRVAKIEMKNMKTKHEKILEAELNMLNSRHDMCSNCHIQLSSSAGYKKSDVDCVSKSIIEAQGQNQRLNTQQSERKSDSAIQNQSRLLEKFNRKLHYKNTSSLNRKNVAFKRVESKGDELEIDSLTWQLKIAPQVMATQRSQSKQRILQRFPSGNNMNNTFSTYKDHKRMKTKNFIDTKNQLQIERVFCLSYSQRIFQVNGDKSEPKLLGIRGLTKKNTQGSSSDSQYIIKQVTQKWLDNDKSNESVSHEVQEDIGIDTTFCKNNIQTEIVQSKEQNFDNKPFHSNSQKSNKDKFKTFQTAFNGNDKQNNTQTLFRKGASSKSYKNLQQQQKSQTNNLPLQNQDEPINSGSRISCHPNSSKFPKFLKFSPQQKITLTIKQLINLFFDIQTAKNFQYINLFQNDQLRVDTTAKDIRKSNQALTANIKQMQKKNYINRLISKVKGEVASRNMNMTSPLSLKASGKINKNNVIISECQTMSGTFSDSLMKTQFWNQLQNDKPSQYHSSPQQLVKIYDCQTLVAVLFRQLRDLKRTSFPTTPQMTNYQLIRNFLRYPYSAITLQNDKTFLQKQRQESGIEYLELRKVMNRVFKLHKNCKAQVCNKNSFEKLGMKHFGNGGQSQGNDGETVLCAHLVAFYEAVGVLLLPKQGEGGNENF